jgi:hypothetical protein
VIPLSASDPSCGMLHFSLTVTKSPNLQHQQQQQQQRQGNKTGLSSNADSPSVSNFSLNPSPPDQMSGLLQQDLELSVRRKTTDRRFSSDPRPSTTTADDETSPFLIGSLKFRRRAFHQQRGHFEKVDGSSNKKFETSSNKKFEMLAPPNRKLSVPVDLCGPSSTDVCSPQQLVPSGEPVLAEEAAASSRGPSRNPSPNKRTSSGKKLSS